MRMLLKIHPREKKNYRKQFSVRMIFHLKIEFLFRQWIQNNLLLHFSLNRKIFLIIKDNLTIKLWMEKDKRLVKEEIKIKIILII
jgi:hypothetical protein